jgi:hypothetical protein
MSTDTLTLITKPRLELNFSRLIKRPFQPVSEIAEICLPKRILQKLSDMGLSPNFYGQSTVPKHRDRKAHIVTYADDFVILSRRKSGSCTELVFFNGLAPRHHGRTSDSDAARTCIRTQKAGPGKTTSPEFPSK